MIRIEHLQDPAEAAPVLRILRHTLDDTGFAMRLGAAKAQGYRVIAARRDAQMVGALGYRFICYLCWGKTLFIDDLVVDPAHRSGGVGQHLLEAARGVARQEGCDHLRLCSGLAREDAHRFYATNGVDKTSFQFATRIER